MYDVYRMVMNVENTFDQTTKPLKISLQSTPTVHRADITCS